MSSAVESRADVAVGRVRRHALTDRLFHWITAACVLTLLATAFLPIVGLDFPWVTAHWIAGVVLLAAVLVHVVRALFWQRLRTVAIGRADIRDALAIAAVALRRSSIAPAKPGKYSVAQKTIHWLFAIVLIAALATGVLMLAGIDTPWWRRNPYWLSESSWGVVFVLHDLAALTLITMVMTHVYFALRPEKLVFTRAMLRGWITRREYVDNHDPQRWTVES